MSRIGHGPSLASSISGPRLLRHPNIDGARWKFAVRPTTDIVTPARSPL